MAQVAKPLTAEDIVRDVRGGQVAPVYYLMGEEDYYINELSEYLMNNLLKPEERDFNLDVVYGAETDMAQVVELARAYPLMAERRVVVVREAQAIRSMDALDEYLKKPNPSTVLIFCHKHGVLDKRKSVTKKLQQVGVVYESKRLYDSQLPAFITRYLKRQGLAIERDAAQMLALHVGADLCRLASEMDKLALAIPKGETMVTAALVEQQTGVSRDYNDFALQEALVTRDMARSIRIVKYYQGHWKPQSFIFALSNLFTLFSNIMLAYYAPDKSARGVAAWLGMPEWKAEKEIIPAMRNYSGVKTMLILAEIRKTDARTKGVEGDSGSAGELFQDLVFFILQ